MTIPTVVITGGSSGIGLDLAKAYARRGAHLALLARDRQRLEAAVAECEPYRRDSRQEFLAFPVDVGDPERLAAVTAQVSRQLPVPALVILSAGIVTCERFAEQDSHDFESVLRTNLLGSRAVAHAFLPAMLEAGRGRLVFISSLGGLIPCYGYSAYSASKFAVVGMAGALRQELEGSGVGVTLVCPPEVDTPMVAREAESILPQTRLIKDVGGTLQVSRVTAATLKGIDRGKFLVIPGAMARFSYWQSRWFPRLFNAQLRWLARIAGRREN